MRVLFLAPAVPWPPDSGSRIRVWQLLRFLGDEAEVHLAAVRQPGLPEEAQARLEQVCASVHVCERSRRGVLGRLSQARIEGWFHSRELRAFAQGELDRGRYDLVHVDELSLARSLDFPDGQARVLHHHKLELELAWSLLRSGDWRARLDLPRLRALEADAAQRYPRQITCCREDALRLVARYPWLKVDVVANGADCVYFQPTEEARDPNALLYLGTLSYPPNEEAILRFAREDFPALRERRPELRLRIVGRDETPEIRALHGDGIEVVGRVADVRPELARAAMLVVPLRVGGGSRLKLAEALAAGCPVVTTQVGAEGFELEPGRHLRVCAGLEDFAAAVEAELTTPSIGAAERQAARALVEERYGWRALARELARVWREATE